MGTYYRAELLANLGLMQPTGRVLDVGGFDGYVAAKFGAERCVSVDIDVDPKHKTVDYLRGDGLNLPFAAGSFDAVYALDVLEHVDDETQFVSELLRVLKPGGRLVLTTPQDDIRIFPGRLTSWANRRWQHWRVPGYSPPAVASYIAGSSPARVEIRPLRASGFLKLYLPLSVMWRLAQGPAKRVLSAIARLDSRGSGRRGYVLAVAEK
jgi:SAM-dependent methyltransferase